MFHDSHIWSFLRKYEDVTNNLACIVRAFEDVEFLQIHCAAAALIGIHLIEPYLSLTTSTGTNYAKLIPAMQQLYIDLTTVPGDKLLCTESPAFGFVSRRRFEDSLKKWDNCILYAIKEFVSNNHDRVAKVISLILPKLGEGFHLQRANVFGFGNFDRNSSLLVTQKDIAMLNNVPIHNLAAERHVGSVNYGLGIHGAKQLNIVSSSIAKSKSIDLIELKPMSEFQKYRYLTRKDGKLLDILTKWTEEQDRLKKEGLSSKEIKNSAADARKIQDLKTIKAFGDGPITSPEDTFIGSDVSDKRKEERLYCHVQC